MISCRTQGLHLMDSLSAHDAEGDCIVGKKVLVTIADDLSEYKMFARTEGAASEVAAMMSVYIKKLNLQEKVNMGFEFMEENGGISQLLLED